MMDKPAIPLSSSSSFQQYHQYIHSSAMQLQPFLRTRPLQLCHGGLQGALRNYHPLWHEPPHQMWQIKHLKKAFFGNKSTKISLEAILTVHIIYMHLKNRRHDCNRCAGILSTVPMSDPKRRCTSSRDPNSMGAEGPGTEMTQLQWSLRRALAWSIPNPIRKCATNPSINMKNLNQDGKSKGTLHLHHVLCLPAQHIATITSENFCVSLSLGQATLLL